MKAFISEKKVNTLMAVDGCRECMEIVCKRLNEMGLHTFNAKLEEYNPKDIVAINTPEKMVAWASSIICRAIQMFFSLSSSGQEEKIHENSQGIISEEEIEKVRNTDKTYNT